MTHRMRVPRRATRSMGAYLAGLALLTTLAGQLMVGCAGTEATRVDPAVEAARRHAEAVMRQARAEVTAVRAELASTRIGAAKKEAEVRELQRQLAQLREDSSQLRRETVELKRTRAEAQQQAEAKLGELSVLRAERDGLAKAKSELQGQLAEVPKLRQIVSDASLAQERLQQRVEELESTLASLMAEMVSVKQLLTAERQKTESKPAKQKASREKTAPSEAKSAAAAKATPSPSSALLGAPAAPAAGAASTKDR